MFWNHGDSYSGSGKGAGTSLNNCKESWVFEKRPKQIEKLPPKCLTLQATRLALRMIDEQGWILRNDIIWYKPNHMPESVKDRFTKAYEHVFMFVKKEKYWFDLDAVREPHKKKNKPPKYELQIKYSENDGRPKDKQGTRYRKNLWRIYAEKGLSGNSLGKNPGDVWIINTEPFPEAHFAVFSTELVERCILASCPEWICKKCGKPRERIVEVNRGEPKPSLGATKENGNVKKGGAIYAPIVSRQTIGWTDCGCGAGWESGIVLDPFLGSGTTALVAEKLNRRWIGIEINPKYCKMAKKRIEEAIRRRLHIEIPFSLS
jgi:hypothetical protein